MRMAETQKKTKARYETKVTIGKKPDGQLIRKSFYSTKSMADARKIAKAWMAEYKAEQLVGIIETNKPKEVSVSSWAKQWLDIYKSGRVKVTTFNSSYERPVRLYVIPYFKNTNITDVLPVDIQKFISTLECEKSKSTCDKVMLCLNGIFETAVDNGLCQRNPCRNIKVTTQSVQLKRGHKRVYTQEQVQSILSFAKTHKYGLSIQILLENGLRVSELLGLQWEDFDLNNKTMIVQRAVTDDNGKTIISDILKSDTSYRILPISDSLVETILSRRNNDSGFIHKSTKSPYKVLNNKAFTNKRYATFFKDYKNYIADPEFVVLTPHELRHTCGTVLYERTHDIYAVSKFLGHSSIDITSKYYVHSNVEQLRNSLDII